MLRSSQLWTQPTKLKELLSLRLHGKSPRLTSSFSSLRAEEMPSWCITGLASTLPPWKMVLLFMAMTWSWSWPRRSLTMVSKSSLTTISDLSSCLPALQWLLLLWSKTTLMQQTDPVSPSKFTLLVQPTLFSSSTFVLNLEFIRSSGRKMVQTSTSMFIRLTTMMLLLGWQGHGLLITAWLLALLWKPVQQGTRLSRTSLPSSTIAALLRVLLLLDKHIKTSTMHTRSSSQDTLLKMVPLCLLLTDKRSIERRGIKPNLKTLSTFLSKRKEDESLDGDHLWSSANLSFIKGNIYINLWTIKIIKIMKYKI